MDRANSIPSNYLDYDSLLENELSRQYSIATGVRRIGYDTLDNVECPIVLDLADRVAKLLEIPIAERLRQLLQSNRTETAAIIAAREAASGKYPLPKNQNRAETAIRIGLAIITDGVTVAPIQGVSAVRTDKRNHNGSEYLSIEFAGPMRSAGGTESAFTLVIADQVRKVLGLEKYNAASFDDEVGRFVEELRIYERDVGNFQYKVTDSDIKKTIENLPVEIDGVWTDNYEVVIHRDMHRISTNKVRGGALRVLNDGIVGKSKKMLKLVSEVGVDDWGWLSELSGGRQQGTDETKANLSHFDEVISGRPVLSMPGRLGAFRLRYGRAPNMGIHAVGMHPSLLALLDYPVVVGTQIKVDLPGKAASVAIVDTIEPPTVRLRDGSVLRVRDAEQATALSPELDSVLYLGDLLVAFGDFLENNTKLVPSAYVEEWWMQDLRAELGRKYSDLDAAAQALGLERANVERLLKDFLDSPPTLETALRISGICGVPLHPRYLLYWDQLKPQEILSLRETLRVGEDSQVRGDPAEVKPLLERLGAEHTLSGDGQVLVVKGDDAKVIRICLGLDTVDSKGTTTVPPEEWGTSIELVSKLSGLDIRHKSSTCIGVRVGRPEKAMLRKMKPPVQGLFPVGKSLAHMSRDIVLASTSEVVEVELVNLECRKCERRVTTAKCPFCKSPADLFKTCAQCGKKVGGSEAADSSSCPICGSQLRSSSVAAYPLAQELKKASQRVGYEPKRPLKGVLGLSNELKIPEHLEKVLLRQKYDLSVYRDGTVRYDATNVPLTHFKPMQIRGTGVQKLRELGYAKDINGDPLEREDQTLELLIQDIVIPSEAGDMLTSVAQYVDELLVRHYGTEPYYNARSREDLIGQVVIGLAPHTSVGIVGRVVGYTNAQACFATPYWHSAKRRDCDGDGDSIILLMDVLLNFSKKFLPSIIGGLMDAPLLIQPIVLPSEVQRQAHHADVSWLYPLEFYEAAGRGESPAEAAKYIDIIKRRLDTKAAYSGFGFTHNTNSITIRRTRSSYSTLTTLTEKLDRQIELAQKIRAVSVDEVVKSVLRTHLLPDIIGNIKAFTAQRFRCKACGAKYRRMPVKGTCVACVGGELQASVTRGSVEKYLQLGLRLSSRYDVGGYLRSRFVLAAEELATLFEPQAHQTDLRDYSSSSSLLLPNSSFSAIESAEPIAPLRTLSIDDDLQSARVKVVEDEDEAKRTLTTTTLVMNTKVEAANTAKMVGVAIELVDKTGKEKTTTTTTTISSTKRSTDKKKDEGEEQSQTTLF